MKKKKTKATSKKKNNKVVTVGRVVPEITIWCFSEDKEVIRHYADHLANAILLSYNLNNFGVQSFGLSEE